MRHKLNCWEIYDVRSNPEFVVYFLKLNISIIVLLQLCYNSLYFLKIVALFYIK